MTETAWDFDTDSRAGLLSVRGLRWYGSRRGPDDMVTTAPVGPTVTILGNAPGYVDSAAEFGPHGMRDPFRYGLIRRWIPGRDYVAFILLNPSTADATRDDPTIRRCRRFAADAGFGAMAIVNLFALRATDPKALRVFVGDPVGPENDAVTLTVCRHADMVIAAWGVHGQFRNRAKHVLRLLRGVTPLHAMRVTSQGHPAHPLYLPKTVRPLPWTAE